MHKATLTLKIDDTEMQVDFICGEAMLEYKDWVNQYWKPAVSCLERRAYELDMHRKMHG